MAYIPPYEGQNIACTVLRIERSSIHDGSGFRTVVFFKGCPLRCRWCSTPESQSRQVETTKDGSKAYGQTMTVEEILREVRKDIPFYFHSGGGMTLSGGEILAQPAAAAALLRQARREGIHTAIETSFYAPVTAVEEVLPYVQDAFVDLKLNDREKHLAYCGAENGNILYNLLHTNEMDWRGRLILRVPVIPGVNDDPQELEQIAWFCTKLTRLDHIQLLPYHRLGVDTYRKLGRAYLLADTLVPTAEHMEACRAVIRKYYPHVI